MEIKLERLNRERLLAIEELQEASAKRSSINIQIDQAKRNAAAFREYADPVWFCKVTAAKAITNKSILGIQKRLTLINGEIKAINNTLNQENKNKESNREERKYNHHVAYMDSFYEQAKLLLNETAFERVNRSALEKMHCDLK